MAFIVIFVAFMQTVIVFILLFRKRLAPVLVYITSIIGQSMVYKFFKKKSAESVICAFPIKTNVFEQFTVKFKQTFKCNSKMIQFSVHRFMSYFLFLKLIFHLIKFFH